MEVGDVREMHQHFDLGEGKAGPSFPDDGVVQHRIDFIQEEFDELKEAVDNRDFPKFFDALIDLTVVIKGTAVLAGITPECWAEAWDEVARANMAKVKREAWDHHNGLSKPEGWKPPDISAIVEKYKVPGE